MKLTLRLLSLFVAFVTAQLIVSAQAPSPLQIVERERSAYSTEDLRDPATIVKMLRGVASGLNAAGHPDAPYGILEKSGGHNCVGYSCDIICSGNGPQQKQWDVLEDAGGASKPRWDGPLSTIAVRTCDFGTAPIPTPPTPQPPDVSAILARLTALEAEVTALRSASTAATLDRHDIRAVLAAESRDIRAIIASLPPATIDCASLPPYRGGTWFGSITSRPVCK